METGRESPTNFSEYIAAYPRDVQETLKAIRAVIKNTAPDATETIKYGIPTFVLNGNLAHFGAFKTHIGFYPTPSGIEAFKDDLAPYKVATGSVQFPLDQPIPLSLIEKIVKFRVKEAKAKSMAMRKK